jgi:predicted AlkP superfamily pyrophosphatase or phosphodiesterase
MVSRFRRVILASAALVFLPIAQGAQPIVVLIGVDGFRWDYLEKFSPPNLTELAKQGVSAEYMTPSFPTLTFPNFYTLATGLRPASHGIIGNTMFDPEFNAKFALGEPSVQEGRWWGGEPIWVTAEKQGLRSACMFWPGSEAEIAGKRPWEWRKYDSKVTPEERVRIVLDWLALPEKERPRLITLYFHEADSAGHKFGPNSKETADAVAQVDTAIGTLREGVHRLGLDGLVNYVVVADHGMTETSPDRVVALSALIDLTKVQIDFVGSVAGIRPREGTSVEEIYQALAAKPEHYAVYRKEEMPERLHFRDNPRIPPIVVIADDGWYIQHTPVTTPAARETFPKGAHGFDPDLPAMRALFVAAGPAFRSSVMLPAFENIQVYNLLCATLGLKPAKNDGDERLSREVLVSPPK